MSWKKDLAGAGTPATWLIWLPHSGRSFPTWRAGLDLCRTVSGVLVLGTLSVVCLSHTTACLPGPQEARKSARLCPRKLDQNCCLFVCFGASCPLSCLRPLCPCSIYEMGASVHWTPNHLGGQDRDALEPGSGPSLCNWETSERQSHGFKSVFDCLSTLSALLSFVELEILKSPPRLLEDSRIPS